MALDRSFCILVEKSLGPGIGVDDEEITPENVDQ
jgi:hypothetical protein